ncbi:glycoside hydrolase family 97 N-terminal domain-containing protein [Puia dinghuensis]|uniref:Uncharacterized protein n=1 Tax=Puia dinghuensis TaxID=1792502 RepID=A0A8J2UCJ4_9BACT|nr:glycoside hydrolase family 97 N-terminal domain-containing protein [Puia dinghuensis]GGA98291.1 hypothetical protein GCM10011511_22000 [Puia dinghuensis]
MRNLFLLVVIAPCVLRAQGVTLQVSPSGPYTSIQKAADAAHPGDHIVVHAGTYHQQVGIRTPHLAFSAAPGEKVIIDGRNQLPAAFAATQPIDSITIEGFTITRFATPPASMDGEQPGAITTGGGAHWIIRHNTITDIKGSAISIGQPGHPYPESRFNHPAYSDLPTDITTVGHHHITGNTISHCGQSAIFGLLHGSASLIDSNHIEATGGAAIHLALTIDAIIRDNTIKSDTGIFLGPLYQGARITGNTIASSREALRLFDSHGPLLIDNNNITSNITLIGAEANVFVKNTLHNTHITNDTLPMHPWATSSYLPHSLVIKQTIPVLPLENRWDGNTTGIFPLTMQAIEDPAGNPIILTPPVKDTDYTAWPLTRVSPAAHPQPFVHPGALHTAADLQRIKDAVAKGLEPWKTAFTAFAADPASSAGYIPHPVTHVERSLLTGQGKNIGNLEKDGNAAYQNALMYCITGDEAHAKKALEILNGWSSTLQTLDGTDVELGAGICGLKFANAAELMRSAYPSWPAADIQRCQSMLLHIFYPPLRYFAMWAHGNWDLVCMKSMMAIGIFCDDHPLFDRAVDYFYHGPGNGSLRHYIVNDSGQVQESGRDQQHTQLGIGQLAEICQMAWSQGLDLYGADDSRLLLGFEYVARYNLGEDVPFTPYTDVSHRFPASRISEQGRGRLRSIYEMVLNHYQQVGLPSSRLTYTRMAAEKLRPEGPGFGADHPGFGTLLFFQAPADPLMSRINSWIDSGYYDGASLLIVKDTQTVYEHYFGAYTPATVAYIASAGKWLTAATIAAVVDEGRLSWDDKVKKWLPDFTGAKGEATLRQLLSHTAGYPDYQPAGQHPDDYQSLRESVAHIRSLPADTLPGTLFHYGGLAMQVAGRMAELATGKNWETLFEEKIAGPLDMPSTHFTPVDSTPGHNPMLGGGARTTLNDYAHFLAMIAADGVYKQKRILSAEAIRELEANQVKAAHVPPNQYVEHARGDQRTDIYGLGEWREEVDADGNATLLSSPGWAGAYPWIDKTNNSYGIFLAHVNVEKANAAHFSAFYSSPVLPILARHQTTILSPDKNVKVLFYQKDLPSGKRAMYYTLTYKNKPIVEGSKLDIQLDNHLSEEAMALKIDTHTDWCENLTITGISTYTKDTTWQPLYGERNTIPDHYSAAVVHLVKDDNPIYTMDIEFRAYNEGVAFRYFFPENPKGTYYRVVSENTEFHLPPNTKGWFTNWAQGPYTLQPLNDWPGESERPLTLQLDNGLYACLAEGAMTDYSRTKFKLSKEKENTILTSMDDPADLISPIGTPWRLILVGEKPGDLIEHNYLVLNVNAPNRIKEDNWVRPGKEMRLMTQTPNDAFANIDFLVKHKMQYLLLDWKWYGPAFTFSSDATHPVPSVGLPAILQYAEKKGIGVWLYVNMQALYAQSDSLFRVYQHWGVKGVKFGFVQVGSHRWTTWLEEMLKKAAENKIMINIHDDWRPTGEQRSWPNLLTAEGIRGNEEMPDATHNTILPFTRFIAGPADYTLCYYDQRIKTTHAHQLALAAVCYSPLQTLYWYDKPSSSRDEPELEFWDNIPTTWDDTKVLQGFPGQYITVARRKGEEWFIGTLNNNDGRDLRIMLDFLPKGKKYNATVYTDDPNTPTQTHVSLQHRTVDAGTIIETHLLPSGGQAIWLRPIQ